MVNAAFEGLSVWANDHDEAASLVHRDRSWQMGLRKGWSYVEGKGG